MKKYILPTESGIRCNLPLNNNPFILENAYYQNNSLNPNTLNKEGLINLWGKPYYPNFPFILERLNKCFFMTNYKVVFLISHENTVTGAVNAILNVKYMYEKNNVKTILLYLPDIMKNNIDIVAFIKEESAKLNCSPIVICNTLCCYNIVRTLSKTNITTYWYIHEWYEPNGHFDFLQENFDLFNSNINIIFICKKSYQQYKKFILNIKNEVIIYNRIPLEVLNDKKNKQPEVPINKASNDLFILIIGTVDDRKNQQKFIDDIFYKIINRYPHVKLLIVGKIIVNLHIKQEYKNDIICTELVSNALPYIELADIVVSYSNNEVYPLSILETLYCGKPFVSSNVGGINEIIENGKNGYLFENNDYKSCFNILSKLIENKELRKKIGENGYKNFLENSNDNISSEQFLLLLSTPIIYN
jgi:glycosyltransferase involved in cell wall biosynthesis